MMCFNDLVLLHNVNCMFGTYAFCIVLYMRFVGTPLSDEHEDGKLSGMDSSFKDQNLIEEENLVEVQKMPEVNEIP